MDNTNLSSTTVADAAPAPARFSGSDVVSARLQQLLALLFPSNLVAKAVLFAVVVALLPLLPTSQAPRIWELPHILLLGVVISYGVFGQRNADDEVVVPVAASSKIVDDDESVESYVSQILQGPLVFEGNAGDDGRESNVGGIQAWSSQYYRDDPLVVVSDAGSKGDAGEKPLLLPVRKLKPAAEEPATGNVSDDGIYEETEFLVPNEEMGDGGVREHVMSSPSSVLDAGLALSTCSPPAPPPPLHLLGGARGLGKARAKSFNDHAVGDLNMSGRAVSQSVGGNRFRSNSAIQATRRGNFADYEYDPLPVVPSEDQVAADDELDGVAAASESDSSFSSDDMVRDGDDEGEDDYEEEEEERADDNSCDEELFELATRPGPEEDEVDRKADEFIAKFREQIRMQRAEQSRR